MIAVSDKDFICSKEKDNGIHSCANLPPFKMPRPTGAGEDGGGNRSDHLLCTEPLDPGIRFFNQSFNETHCTDWNRYYTHCRAGESLFMPLASPSLFMHLLNKEWHLACLTSILLLRRLPSTQVMTDT